MDLLDNDEQDLAVIECWMLEGWCPRVLKQ